MLSANGVQPRPPLPRRRDLIENGKITFSVIDRIAGICWCRPTKSSFDTCFCLPSQLSKIRQPALRRSKGLERVKGRYTRPGPRFLKIEPRIGKADAPLSSTDRESKGEAFVFQPALIGGELGGISPRKRSRRRGSSTILRGNIFSASPGTKTASKVSPRAASTGPTNNLP